MLVRNSTDTKAYNNTIANCSSFGTICNGSSNCLFYLNAFAGNNGATGVYSGDHAQGYDDSATDVMVIGIARQLLERPVIDGFGP